MSLGHQYCHAYAMKTLNALMHCENIFAMAYCRYRLYFHDIFREIM